MYMSHVPDSWDWGTDALNVRGRVWSVMSSGPHPSGDSTDDHLQVQNHHDWVARDCLVLGSDESVHKLLLRLSLGVNLLTQPFSNRLHNSLVYLNLHV